MVVGYYSSLTYDHFSGSELSTFNLFSFGFLSLFHPVVLYETSANDIPGVKNCGQELK